MVRPNYRIVTVIYDGSDPGFDKLLKVFLHSCACNAGKADVRVLVTERPRSLYPTDTPSYADNSLKLRIWEEELAESDLPIAFLDADMLLLRSLNDAFGPCHVNLTLRPGAMWLNAGAVFCKPTKEAVRVLRTWRETNDKIRADREWLMRAIEHHNGLNQTAMVHLLENEDAVCFDAGDVGFLPCDKYNCMDSTWKYFDVDRCSLLHVKGRLRDTVLGRTRPMGSTVLPYLIWKHYEVAEMRCVRAV